MLVTRREAAELSGTPETTVKKAVDQKVIAARRRGSQSWIEVDDVPVLAMLGLLTDVDEALRRAERYVDLREKWIVRDPEVKGGEPVIKGSRVGVHTLAERIAQGEPEAVLDEDFPHIPAEAREIAVSYARANPRRGRPKQSAPSR
jgi:uncharacterized protein (DUF433 family)